MNEIGTIRIYKDDEGFIRLTADMDLHSMVTRYYGLEGKGENFLEALEDLYMNAEMI